MSNEITDSDSLKTCLLKGCLYHEITSNINRMFSGGKYVLVKVDVDKVDPIGPDHAV